MKNNPFSFTFGSLFSGAGLMDYGLEKAGLKCKWLCEIDPDARRVLAHHWPGLPCHEDVRNTGKHNLTSVDMIVGGFPCTDLSVAGVRAGLVSGTQSGLFFEMVRIIDELKPTFCLFENVPGLLSSFSPIEPPPFPVEGSEWEVEEDSDFETVLRELDRIGYRGAVTSLDAQWFGVAQRRQRLFGLFTRGNSGAKRCAEILSFANRSAGHLAASREAGEDIARTLRSRSASAGVNRPGRGGEDDENLVCGTLNYGNRPYLVAPSKTARQGKGGFTDPENDGLVTVPQIFETRIARNGRGQPSDCAHALRGHRCGETSDCRPMLLAPGISVRRLTPTECLRLMGAPDSWLDLDPPLSDSAKYRLCGNGVVVSVAAWLGQRLMAWEVQPQC